MIEFLSKKVKIKHESDRRSRKLGLVTPLYETIPKLGDSGPINRKEFAKWYEFSLKGLSPKRFRIPRDVIVEEIQKYFRLIHNRNGYSLCFQ